MEEQRDFNLIAVLPKLNGNLPFIYPQVPIVLFLFLLALLYHISLVTLQINLIIFMLALLI